MDRSSFSSDVQLYPSEINPLETRSAGLAVASCANLLFSFGEILNFADPY